MSWWWCCCKGPEVPPPPPGPAGCYWCGFDGSRGDPYWDNRCTTTLWSGFEAAYDPDLPEYGLVLRLPAGRQGEMQIAAPTKHSHVLVGAILKGVSYGQTYEVRVTTPAGEFWLKGSITVERCTGNDVFQYQIGCPNVASRSYQLPVRENGQGVPCVRVNFETTCDLHLVGSRTVGEFGRRVWWQSTSGDLWNCAEAAEPSGIVVRVNAGAEAIFTICGATGDAVDEEGNIENCGFCQPCWGAWMCCDDSVARFVKHLFSGTDPACWPPMNAVGTPVEYMQKHVPYKLKAEIAICKGRTFNVDLEYESSEVEEGVWADWTGYIEDACISEGHRLLAALGITCIEPQDGFPESTSCAVAWPDGTVRTPWPYMILSYVPAECAEPDLVDWPAIQGVTDETEINCGGGDYYTPTCVPTCVAPDEAVDSYWSGFCYFTCSPFLAQGQFWRGFDGDYFPDAECKDAPCWGESEWGEVIVYDIIVSE